MHPLLRRVLSSYLTFLVLTMLIGLLLGTSTVLERFNGKIQENIRSLQNFERRLHFEQITGKMDELHAAALSRYVPVVGKDEAKAYMIRAVDQYRQEFAADIRDYLTDDGVQFLTRVEFSITPQSPEELLTLLHRFDENRTPVITAERMMIQRTNDGYSVKLSVLMVQPYVEVEW